MNRRERTAVIADRHPMWLEAVERLLEEVGVAVVGKTTELEEAPALVLEHRPDVLVMDLDHAQIGRGDPAAQVRRAFEAHPGLTAVVISASDDPEHINAALTAGAAVYCLKTTTGDDLAAAVRQALDSSIYFALTRSVSRAIVEAPSSQGAELSRLTRREVEILRLVAEGYSNAQLADMLSVTMQTVKFHLSNIFRKLEVSNRTEASRWAQVHGLLPTRAATADHARDFG